MVHIPNGLRPCVNQWQNLFFLSSDMAPVRLSIAVGSVKSALGTVRSSSPSPLPEDEEKEPVASFGVLQNPLETFSRL